MARILVIDDEAPLREVLRRTLEKAGHSVVEAANGEIGLRAMRVAPVDLVVTDIVMPEKEGFATIRELQQQFPQVRIIAISGGSPQVPLDFLPMAHSLGADRILAKPFTPAELLAAVEAALS